MITLLTDISEVTFSKNPIRLKLQTNNYKQVNGQTYSMVINFTAAANGSIFTISILGVVYTFTGVPTPDDSGLQFKHNATNLPTEMVNVLNSHYVFHNHYVATYINTTSFGIAAREVGSAFNLSFGGNVTFSTGVSQAGINRVYRENFGILAELWVETSFASGEYNLITTQLKVPDEFSQIEFNWQKNLDAVVAIEADLPDLFATSPNYCSNHLRKYYIKYAEQWGAPVVTRKLINSAVKMVYSGGISYTESVFQPDVLVTGYFSYAKKFLTLSPVSKPISKSQHEYLYKAFPGQGTTTYFTLYINAYLADNTSMLNVPFYAGSSIDYNDIWYFPVGYNQLDLDSLSPSVPIVRYQVWLGGDADPTILYSEVKEYVVDLNAFDDSPQIIFKNSVAGMETLRLRSYASQKGNAVTRNAFQRYLSPFASINAGGAMAENNIEGFQYVKAISGLYPKEWVEHFIREILHSESLYEILGGKYNPITIISDDIQHVQDSPGLYSFSFEYRSASTDVVQSPEL